MSSLKFLATYLILSCFLSANSRAQSGDLTSQKRKKVIDFEGELVEGVNRKSLDSLSQIAVSKEKKSKPHLYHRRQSFRPEISETLKDMRSSS